MMKVKIGNKRNPLNHFKIDDPSVSFDHLELTWEGQIVTIVDMASTNGTYKNEIKVRKTTITDKDKIRLGYSIYTGQELKSHVKKYIFRERVTFYDEFAAMESKFIEYDKERNKIKGQRRNKIILFRVGFILTLILLFFKVGVQLGLPQELRIGVTIIGGSVAFFIANKLFPEENVKSKLLNLRDKYYSQLQCPKCCLSLIDRDYDYWKNIRKCKKCQANWVN